MITSEEQRPRPFIPTTILTTITAILALGAGACGPTFDPPSLIESTRVLGARVEVAGAADRATPAPGESATVTWLIATPEGTMGSITPTPTPTAAPTGEPAKALGWAFALCAQGAPNDLGCDSAPFAVYQGTDNPPRVTIAVPGAETLGAVGSVILFGRICDGTAPTFDPQTGLPACEGGAAGTTASLLIGLAGGDSGANLNPIADRGLTLDGQPWPALAAGQDPGQDPGDHPCAAGPRVRAGTADHVIALVTIGDDRERYTALHGDPPVPTGFRESLQISQFATAGKLKSPYTFIEGDVADDAPAATVKWSAPPATDVSAPVAVAFTFVVRDNRGGTDWTTRAVCVAP